MLLASVMEAGQGVGDAPNDFNPGLVALKYSFIFLVFYTAVYYGVTLLLNINNSKNEKGSKRINYSSFLAVYDYGMGGIWVLIESPTRIRIELEYPELTVYDDRPEWMDETQKKEFIKDCIVNNMCWNIDSPPTGWLKSLVESREK